MSLTVHNVGQGNFITFARPGKPLLLFDGGSSALPEGVESTKLLARGLFGNIGDQMKPGFVWFVSHPDKDHLNLVGALCKLYAGDEGRNLPELPKRNLFVFGGDQNMYTTDTALGVLRDIHECSGNIMFWGSAQGYCELGPPMALPLAEFCQQQASLLSALRQLAQCRVDVVGIPQVLANMLDDSSNVGNIVSLIVKVSFIHGQRKRSFLVPGDATGDSWDYAFVQHPSWLEVDVAVASHHGATTHGSNGPTFALATKAKCIIYSAGVNARCRHPRPTAILHALLSPYLGVFMDAVNPRRQVTVQISVARQPHAGASAVEAYNHQQHVHALEQTQAVDAPDHVIIFQDDQRISTSTIITANQVNNLKFDRIAFKLNKGIFSTHDCQSINVVFKEEILAISCSQGVFNVRYL